MYEWYDPNSTSPAYNPQAEVIVWALPDGYPNLSSGDVELEFDGWCENSSATASFSWNGNLYTSPCSTFTGADLIINLSSGLPEGYVIYDVVNSVPQADNNTTVTPFSSNSGWSVVNATNTSWTQITPTANAAFNTQVTVYNTDYSLANGGTVNIMNGATILGSATVFSGTATVTMPAMAVGNYNLTASYLGVTGQYFPSSASFTLTVNPPAPTVAISVTPATITLGQSSTLTWSSTNATTCNASGAWTGLQSASGSIPVTPTSAGMFSYTLNCSNGVSSQTLATTLTVNPQPPPVPTVTVTVSPSTITVGESVTVTWSSTNAAACKADSAWNGTQATSGKLIVTPTTAGGFAYSLTCTGAGGTGNGAAGLAVNPAQPPPGSAATVSVTISPSSITLGQSATLTWSSTNATICTADSAWSGTRATSGMLTVTPAATGGFAYSLTCTGAGGAGNGAAGLAVIPVATAEVAPAATKSGGGSIEIWELLALAGLLTVGRWRRDTPK
jgi:hypothetical protein